MQVSTKPNSLNFNFLPANETSASRAFFIIIIMTNISEQIEWTDV